MDKQTLIRMAQEFVQHAADNYIAKDIALSADVAGMQIFEAPIFAFGSAADEYFKKLKHPHAIGEHFRLPEEWLPGAKTVISFFLPFSEAVKKGNRKDKNWPSPEWLHGRIEGQAFVQKLCRYLQSVLGDEGYASVVPALDPRFWSNTDSPEHEAKFTSNWSERHVAFVCGLGTFGLSKGLITPKGMAGRFGSLITTLDLPPDKREYEDLYEYCSMCGKCIKNCPARAITLEKSKDHALCSTFLEQTRAKFAPRYGCGKCQVGVPCESGIPNQ